MFLHLYGCRDACTLSSAEPDTDIQGSLTAAVAAESVPPTAAAVSSSVRGSAGHPTVAARHTPLLLSGVSL